MAWALLMLAVRIRSDFRLGCAMMTTEHSCLLRSCVSVDSIPVLLLFLFFFLCWYGGFGGVIYKLKYV